MTRPLAIEAPVALEFNGIGYAVLMATPTDLGDLAYGFALSERLIDDAGDIAEVDAHRTARGTVLRVTLRPGLAARVADRVRHRVSDSSCGLCGIENLEQALRPLPRIAAPWQGDRAAVFHALERFREHQPLHRTTGAVHGAALCDAEGGIRLVREDVGRHNAFDKLIGAMLRLDTAWEGGFALLSSRCSYELVEKAVLAGCPMLATISAPTSLAVERAAAAGLPLTVLARPDAVLATR
ncbi:formate dehydrogenase accessory sulfurtransferase FdhD [Sphingomonas aracearum]|uniref:formate dehydrogenase accessory sulfurtransferase FdhD n=1 Tax=Sphingomonas aracearum TaxID=2283317 RepID=UPI001EEFEDAC|nr:formate dehydrogenase accessory sulfurtransferase FdhD [Sphingomonas aracearum]